MFGFDPKEKEHKPSAWQDIIFAEDQVVALKNIEAHIASGGKEKYLQTVRYRHKDGSTVYVFCRGAVIEWGADGTPLRMIGTHTDVTEFHTQEIAIARQRQTIDDIREVNQTYLRQFQNRITFVAKISHEIRTPLNGIMGMIECVSDLESLPRQGREYLQ